MIDLDKAKAARREAAGEAPTLVFGGNTYVLPVELPFETSEAFHALAKAYEEKDNQAALVATRDVVRSLLGPDYAAFAATRPSHEDLGALMEGLTEEYGASQGESRASDVSS